MQASVRAGLAPDPQESRAPTSTGRGARRLDTVPTCLQPWALRLSGPADTTSQAVLTLTESGPGCSCPGTRLDHTKAEMSWVPAA